MEQPAGLFPVRTPACSDSGHREAGKRGVWVGYDGVEELHFDGFGSGELGVEVGKRGRTVAAH